MKINNQKKEEKLFTTNYYLNDEDKLNPDAKWPDNTILITGDSMINQLDENRLSKSTNRNIKIRSFHGADFDKMYTNIEPLLKKMPSKVIIHVGTSDAVTKLSEVIIDDFMKFKQFIETQWRHWTQNWPN